MKPVYYFLQGNSCTGSTSRLRADGMNVVDSRYFGKVYSIAEFNDFAIKEISEILANGETEIVIIGSSFGGHLALSLMNALITDKNPILENIIGVVLAGTPPAGTAERMCRAFRPPVEDVEEGGRTVLELLSAPGVMTDAEAMRFVLPAFGPGDSEDHSAIIAENILNVTKNAKMGKTRHEILSEVGDIDEVEFARKIAAATKLVFVHATRDPVICGDYVAEVAHEVGADIIYIDAPHYSHWSNASEFHRLVKEIFE